MEAELLPQLGVGCSKNKMLVVHTDTIDYIYDLVKVKFRPRSKFGISLRKYSKEKSLSWPKVGMGFYLLRGLFLFQLPNGMSIDIIPSQKTLIFPRLESWSLVFEIWVVGIVTGLESMMQVLGDG